MRSFVILLALIINLCSTIIVLIYYTCSDDIQLVGFLNCPQFSEHDQTILILTFSPPTVSCNFFITFSSKAVVVTYLQINTFINGSVLVVFQQSSANIKYFVSIYNFHFLNVECGAKCSH